MGELLDICENMLYVRLERIIILHEFIGILLLLSKLYLELVSLSLEGNDLRLLLLVLGSQLHHQASKTALLGPQFDALLLGVA